MGGLSFLEDGPFFGGFKFGGEIPLIIWPAVLKLVPERSELDMESNNSTFTISCI